MIMMGSRVGQVMERGEGTIRDRCRGRGRASVQAAIASARAWHLAERIHVR